MEGEGKDMKRKAIVGNGKDGHEKERSLEIRLQRNGGQV